MADDNAESGVDQKSIGQRVRSRFEPVRVKEALTRAGFMPDKTELAGKENQQEGMPGEDLKNKARQARAAVIRRSIENPSAPWSPLREGDRKIEEDLISTRLEGGDTTSVELPTKYDTQPLSPIRTEESSQRTQDAWRKGKIEAEKVLGPKVAPKVNPGPAVPEQAVTSDAAD